MSQFSMSATSEQTTYSVTKRDRKQFKTQVQLYLDAISGETDERLRKQATARFEAFLAAIHASQPWYKQYIYLVMPTNVEALNAAEELKRIWDRYKAKSQALAAERARAYANYQSAPSAPMPIIQGNTQPPSAAGSPVNTYSPDPSLFSFNSDWSTHSAVAQSSSPRYAPMQSGYMPQPAAPPAQPQFYAAVPYNYPRGPIGQQGQGVYYAGPGASYPPQAGPYAGQGAYQGQGGAYYQPPQ
ncbi:hypothetical protein C8R46DRAFT_1184545 [Mycena filopes]|nr:hypothetical protein C8R46DRAFT_1184545 [Mycena filopes]